jgi:hypothetical protein
MTDSISKAVAVIRESTESDDAALHRSLIAEGLAAPLAARLVQFLPMVYCRLMLEPSGVRFSRGFQQRLANGQITPEKLLASEPIWNEALAFAKTEIDRGISPKDCLAIAARSAEFDAVNQLLNKGAKLQNLILTPVVLTWPDDVPQ